MFTDHDNFFVMQSIHAIFVVGSGTNLKRISKYQPFADTIHRDHTRIQRRVHAGAEFALLHLAHTAPSKKNKEEQHNLSGSNWKRDSPSVDIVCARSP